MEKHSFFQLNLVLWPLKSIILRKTSPVLRVSTHIYGVSKEIDGKTFIFQVNLGMWPQIDHLVKMRPDLNASTPIYGVTKEADGKTFIFRVNLGMWPLKSIVLEKRALFWWIQHTFLVILDEIDGKTFIFQSKPRHVTPQIDCLMEKQTLFWGFQHTFMGFPRR